MRKMRFEILRSGKKQFFWRMKASNSQTYCHSETYTQAASAKQAIKNIIRAISAGAWDVRDMSKG
jgi:uncharacterized protein YegP (UPF0339 family)